MISDHLAGHIKKTAIAQIAHHADVLRGSSRVPGVGTLDEPLRGYPPQKLTKLHNYGHKIPRWLFIFTPSSFVVSLVLRLCSRYTR